MRYCLSFLLIILLFSCETEQGGTDAVKGNPLFTFGTETNNVLNPLNGDSIQINENSGKLLSFKPIVLENFPHKNPSVLQYHTESIEEGSNKQLVQIGQGSVEYEAHSSLKLVRKGPVLTKPHRINAERIPAAAMSIRDNALFNIRYLDVDQGLKSSYIRTLLQDKKGNIWIGAFENGFFRYNGYDFEYFGSEQGFRSIIDMKEDARGNMWISTWGTDFYKFDGFQFTNLASELKLEQDDHIKSISPAENGTVWLISTKNRIFSAKDSAVSEFEWEKGSDSETLLNFIQLEEESYLVTTKNLFKLSGLQLSKLSISIDSPIKTATGNGKSLWIVSRDELIEVGEKQIKLFSLPENILAVSEYSLLAGQKNLYLGSDKGLLVIDSTLSLQKITEAEGLTNDMITVILEDSDQNTWIGTNGGGVCLLKNASFRHYTDANGLPNFLIKNIHKWKDTLYFTSYPADVSVFSNGHFKSILPEKLKKELPVFSITNDNSGNLWFNIWGDALYSFRNGSFTRFAEENGLAGNTIRSMYFDEDNTLWCATLSGIHKYRFKGNSIVSTEIIGLQSGMLTDRCVEVLRGGGDSLWIATEKSLSLLPDFRKNEIIHFTEQQGLPEESVLDIFIARDRSLWICTDGGGVARINGKEINYFTEKSGLSSGNAVSLIEDESGQIWVSTSNGLNLISKSSGEYKIQNFTKSDGLKATDFYRNALNIDQNNQLWLGSGKALTSIQLKNFAQKKHTPQIYLSRIDTHESKLADSASFVRYENFPNNLTLDYENNHLTFHFYAIDWQVGGLLYSYRLKSEGKAWSNWSAEHKAEFRNLNFGEHQLEIKAKNKNGTESKILTYRFVIKTPWWQSWLARIAFVIAAVLLVYAIIRVRERKLKQKQRELENTVQERTRALELEKQRVTEKNNEILDSISYAKRIQRAILPPESEIQQAFSSYSLFYQPKDIVAGDFYWLNNRNGAIWFAVADCTGHGVPGALVSVVCNNALNRSVNEFGLALPSDILNKTRELVLHEFERSSQDVKDGMDISLFYRPANSSVIYWSGANNPLWIYRDGEMLEWKADRQPIGKYDFAKDFSNHKIELQQSDELFLFTDGFQDQFGGDKNKKLKVVNWRTFLLELSQVPVPQREAYISSWFDTWKGENEQVDDICLFSWKI